MRTAIRTVLTMSCAALIGVTVSAGAATAESPAPDDPRQAALDAAAASGIPGILGEARDENGEWRGSAGTATIPGTERPRTDGRFRVGSVSKTFTAATVLQLVGEGRFELDDVVQDLLPGLLPYPEPITVRQLLQHTSGLPRDLPPGPGWDNNAELDTERFSHFTPESMVRASTTRPLLFAPGNGWAYSNTGFSVLALLVEKSTGRPFEAEVTQRIIAPLGMRDTLMPRDFPFLPGAALRAYEQLYDAPAPRTDTTVYNYSRYVGSGSMISTASDLNVFFKALFDGDLLTPELLGEMKRTVPTPDGYDYGLGLMRIPLAQICQNGGPEVWGHGGDVIGYGTWSMHTEHAERQMTTVSSQNMSAPPETALPRLMAMATEFCTPAAPSAPSAKHDVPATMPLLPSGPVRLR